MLALTAYGRVGLLNDHDPDDETVALAAEVGLERAPVRDALLGVVDELTPVRLKSSIGFVRVENLLVEEISYFPKGNSATLTATLWEFGVKRWVSAQPQVEGAVLGPVTVLDPDSTSLDTQTAKVSSFKPHELHVSGGKPAISHKTIWTVEPETVYALVLPLGFVAEQLSVAAGGEVCEVEQGASRGGNLFYWDILMGSRSELRIEARLIDDPERAEREVASVGVIRGRTKYERLSSSLPRPEVDANSWIRMLEYGSKILG